MDSPAAPATDPLGAARARTRATVLHALAIGALGLAAYSNTFHVPFLLDDFRAVVRNPLAQDLPSFFAGLRDPRRSVALLSFALNGSLGGRAVAGYHAVNLAIHLAAAMLVYVLARFAIGRAAAPPSPLARRAGEAAFVAAALFVAHPVQTEAVTYIVQRTTSLAALLFLGSVAAYGFAATASSRRRRAVLGIAALVLAALALLTKENAAALPLALLAFDVCFLPGESRDRLRRLAPFALLTAGVALLALDPAGGASAVAAEGRALARSPAEGAWSAHLLTQPRVLATYLRLLAWPTGQNVDHDVPISTTPLEAPVLLSVALLGALLAVPAAVAWRRRERSGLARATLFAIGWFVATLSVETILPLADLLVEHRLYLPSVGVFVLAGAAVAEARGRASPARARAVAAAVAAAVLALAIATFARNEIWLDRLTLWSDALRKSPAKPRPYTWVAQDLMERGDFAGAIALLEKAAALRPRYASVFLSLATAHGRLGRLADAERAFRESIEIADRPAARYGLAVLLLGSGRKAEACDQFAGMQALAPGTREVRIDLVPCRFARGDVAGGVAEAERLEREDPGDPVVEYNLAVGYAALDRPRDARDAYRRFLESAGDDMRREKDLARAWLDAHPDDPARRRRGPVARPRPGAPSL